jgi:hypothetical protein
LHKATKSLKYLLTKLVCSGMFTVLEEDMSVDTQVSLPAGTRLRDVADVIAILLGKPKSWTAIIESQGVLGGSQTKHNLKQPTEKGWTEVEGITFKVSETQPECCTINIDGIGSPWWFFYHFEFGKGPGMIGGSRAERICLHRKLADFFGGTVDYQDCDSKSVNYRVKPPAWTGRHDSDEHFHRLQMAKWNLQPMSQEEIAKCERYAAYKAEK